VRNSTRDEGGPFEVSNQVLIVAYKIDRRRSHSSKRMRSVELNNVRLTLAERSECLWDIVHSCKAVRSLSLEEIEQPEIRAA
jgi:hypothetical protein